MSNKTQIITGSVPLTAAQIKSFKDAGIKGILLVVDANDYVGCMNMEGNIRALMHAGLYVHVVAGDPSGNNSDETPDLADSGDCKEPAGGEW